MVKTAHAVARQKEDGTWEVTCPSCKTIINIGNKKPGYYETITCPECGQVMTVS